MAIVGEQALKSRIGKGDISVYLLFGDDGYLKKMYTKKIAEKVAEEDDIFNYQKFFGESDLQDVYDAVLQFPVMSDKKFVILTDYDFEKCEKSAFDKLCTLVAEVPDSCVFVLAFNALDIDIKKSKRFKALSESVEKNNGIVANLEHRTQAELVKMLTNGAQKRGCNFEVSAARYLVETSGEDIDTLKNELEKLCHFANGGTIDKQTVDNVSIKTVEAGVYTLSRHILQCNMQLAMKNIDELFYLRVEPIVILATISSFYVDMYRAFLGKSKGLSASEIAKEFSLRDFVVRNALEDSKKFDLNKFSLSFETLRAADKALKSFSCDPRTVLEQLAVKLGYISVKGESLD